jgi:hypothetical protein
MLVSPLHVHLRARLIGPFGTMATADHRDVKVTVGHCDIRVADHVVWIRRVTALVGKE